MGLLDQKVEWMAEAQEILVQCKRELHLALIDVMEKSKSTMQVVEVEKDSVPFRQEIQTIESNV